MKLIRRWLATSPPVADITADAVSTHLQRATKPDQFVVFDLDAKNAFAQVKRMKSGGLHVELSRRTPHLEASLRDLGDVTLIDEYGFPSVDSAAGDDSRVAQAVAAALVLLAAEAKTANVARVRTG